MTDRKAEAGKSKEPELDLTELDAVEEPSDAPPPDEDDRNVPQEPPK
jgi:hypothetical protein